MRSIGVGWWAGVASLGMIAGCYASHGADDLDGSIVRDTPARDTPGRDTPGRDAPMRDAPVRDIGRDSPLRDVTLRDVPGGGGPCARDGDCDAGFCVLDRAVAPIDATPVPLVCGGAGFTAPGLECESNVECENGLCALLGGCVEPCIDGGDCREDERCAEVPVVTSDRTLQFAQACVRWTDVPGSVTVTDSSNIAVRPGRSELFSIPASARDHRLILHVADTFELFRSVDRVALTGGATLFDIGTFGIAPQINPAVGFFDLVSILLPNAPWPADLDRGGAISYAVAIGTERSHHRVVMEHDGRGRTLDLNVVFVGIERTASARRVVDQMLEAYGAVLTSMGAALGRVRQFEMVGTTGDTFAIVDTEDEASALFRMSAGAARPAVNVFLASSSPLFLGIAGGIPGAMGVHGTGASGVILSFDDLRAAVEMGFPREFLGVVLGHEIGHFFGLFHSSEVDGSSTEPLPDTAVCDLSNDRDGDGVVIAEECVGTGGDNIMFWGPTLPGSTFSPSQEDIVRAAPVMLP